MLRALTTAVLLLVSDGQSRAMAWGCDGHRAIAMIAERLAGEAADKARTVLARSPVARDLPRFCEPIPADIIADVSTWADDYRSVEPATASWHFIDVPRSIGAISTGYARYCPRGNCAIDAVVAQFNVLKTSTDPRLKANALRFIIHLVGDVHQPLHAITNGDRGGNCVPVTYFSQPPVEDENGNFTPNLHGVWDRESIRTLMRAQKLDDARGLANFIAAGATDSTVAAQAPTAAVITAWAAASHALARTVAYGRLPVDPPQEPVGPALFSCAQNNHVGERMARLHEKIGSRYQLAAAPVIVRQLRLAGERLAAVLKAAFEAP